MDATCTKFDARADDNARLPRPFIDPLESDRLDDDVVVTTRRGISRVALVAASVGARFSREALAHDPMAWLIAPRAMFEGASAIDACLEQSACLRGVLLHDLSLGLDARPADLDDLLADDVEDADRVDAAGEPAIANGGVSELEPPRVDLRLFTATVVSTDGCETVQAFHASLATDEAEIAGRLYMRMGAAMADAVIVEGFDPTMPMVSALVAPALCETLALVAAAPGSSLAAGLDLNVEQRFLT